MELIIYKLFGFYNRGEETKVDLLGRFFNRAAAEEVKEEYKKENSATNSPYTAFTIVEDHEFLE